MFFYVSLFHSMCVFVCVCVCGSGSYVILYLEKWKIWLAAAWWQLSPTNITSNLYSCVCVCVCVLQDADIFQVSAQRFKMPVPILQTCHSTISLNFHCWLRLYVKLAYIAFSSHRAPKHFSRRKDSSSMVPKEPYDNEKLCAAATEK